MRTRYLVVLLALFVPWTMAFGQGRTLTKHDPETTRMAMASALKALGSFGAIVNEQNYRSLGFEKPDDVSRATLGTPIREFMIRLDELQNYTTGQEPLALLHDSGKITFPVMVSGQTRSSVTVVRKDGNWTASGFGAASYVRTLDSLRTEIASRDGKSPTDYFEVDVPALSVFFLGNLQGGKLYLTPLLSSAAMGLERGSTLPAEDAFDKLVPAARSHSGLPR